MAKRSPKLPHHLNLSQHRVPSLLSHHCYKHWKIRQLEKKQAFWSCTYTVPSCNGHQILFWLRQSVRRQIRSDIMGAFACLDRQCSGKTRSKKDKTTPDKLGHMSNPFWNHYYPQDIINKRYLCVGKQTSHCCELYFEQNRIYSYHQSCDVAKSSGHKTPGPKATLSTEYLFV